MIRLMQKKHKIKLNQWVRLHDHNISQKVRVIIEHFKKNVMGLFGWSSQSHGGDQFKKRKLYVISKPLINM